MFFHSSDIFSPQPYGGLQKPSGLSGTDAIHGWIRPVFGGLCSQRVTSWRLLNYGLQNIHTQ